MAESKLSDQSSTDSSAAHGLSTAQLKTVLQVSRALSVTTDLDALLHRIAEATAALLGCERASIFLHDARSNELWSKVALQSTEIRLSLDQGVAGHCFRHNVPVHVPDAYADSRFARDFDRQTGFRTRDLLAAPMVDWDDRPVGVLQALNKIAGGFTEDDCSLLRLLADQAGVAVQRWHLQQSAIQSTSLRHEMQLARRVQESVIPRTPPQVPGLIAAGWMQTASINGGDCYDLWQLPSGDLAVLVADASGHGLPAALVIAQVRALVRTLCETETEPAAVLNRVNRRLNEDFRHVRFVTAFLAFISPKGDVKWCSAGQGPILVRHGDHVRSINANLPPLGIVDALPTESAPAIELGERGCLIIPSDGIVEAFNSHEEQFGEQGIVAVLNGSPSIEPATAIEQIISAVKQWDRRDDPADDQTLVIVQTVGAVESAGSPIG
ncbi:MAG TPA: GAF domain-containing SpoIIE family protein phosphatase [Tepidisphaeraceae bacterium]|nr:GAF domain-containing SpoIIE family protein phosphatase [Tepidisphaeraceae bacterium]